MAGRGAEPAGRRCFAVLYTKNGQKKRKVYVDGVMTVEAGPTTKVTLYDTSAKQVTRLSDGKFNASLEAGDDTQVGYYLVQIDREVPIAEYTSGRIFGGGDTGSENVDPAAALNLSAKARARAGQAPARGASASAGRGQPATTRAAGRGSLRKLGGAAGAAAPSTRPDLPLPLHPRIWDKMRPHQRSGLCFLWRATNGQGGFRGHGAILGDEMGLGKTLQAVALLHATLYPTDARVSRKAVVVCPSSLVRNWAAELKKWTQGAGATPMRAIVVEGGGAQAEQQVRDFSICAAAHAALLVISYDLFRRHAAAINGAERMHLLVCDEGHRLKSSSGSKTLSALSAFPSPRRVLLSGTPLQNDLEEFHALATFVNPGLLGDAAAFRRVYAAPITRARDRDADAAAREIAGERTRELSRISARFVLRRTQAQVLSRILPPKAEFRVFVRPSEVQKRLYARVLRLPQVQRLFVESGAAHCGVLPAIALLRKICNHPSLLAPAAASDGDERTSVEALRRSLGADAYSDDDLDADGAGGAEEDLRGAAAAWLHEERSAPGGAGPRPLESGKMQVLEELLGRIRERDPAERCVLVSNFTETLDLFEALAGRRRWGALRLDGSTAVGERQTLVDRFNSGGGRAGAPFLFLLSAKAGGVGLNLVGANHLVIFEPDWNPATDLQAMARVWRDGQTRPVSVYRFLTCGTLEERIFQRQLRKLELSDAVVDRKDARRNFRAEELRSCFALNEQTACETRDLLGDGAGWRDYRGPQDIPEGPLRDAALALAAAPPDGQAASRTAITFVHVASPQDARGEKRPRGEGLDAAPPAAARPCEATADAGAEAGAGGDADVDADVDADADAYDDADEGEAEFAEHRGPAGPAPPGLGGARPAKRRAFKAPQAARPGVAIGGEQAARGGRAPPGDGAAAPLVFGPPDALPPRLPIPRSFATPAAYRSNLCSALHQEVQLMLMDAAGRLKAALGGAGAGARGDGRRMQALLRRSGLAYYHSVRLAKASGERLFLTIADADVERKRDAAPSAPLQESYAAGDLWLLSEDPAIGCGAARRPEILLVRALWHGPSSQSGALQVEPFGGAAQAPPPRAPRLERGGSRGRSLHALRLGGAQGISQQLRLLSGAPLGDDAGAGGAAPDAPRGKTLDAMPVLGALLGGAPSAAAAHTPAMDQRSLRVALTAAEVRGAADEVSARFSLNEDQRAVLHAASKWFRPADGGSGGGDGGGGADPAPIVLVHGVFGAGKSTLLVALCVLFDAVASRSEARGGGRGAERLRVLVAAATNVAVDRVLGGLLDAGFESVARVGSLRRIAPRLSGHVLLPDGRVSEARAGARRCEEEERRQRLLGARIVGTTCSSAASPVLGGLRLPVVLLDEASQCTEPQSLLPLVAAGSCRAIIVGDPKQLPPQLCRAGRPAGAGAGAQPATLESSLFVRLAAAYAPAVLRTQYRCHPDIADLASRLFYDGKLRSGVGAAQRAPLFDGLPALVLLDVDGAEERSGESFCNRAEASAAASIARHLLRRGVPAERIGVIATYRSQASLIAAQLGDDRVIVNTVDAFQGAERDVIVLSAVRTEGLGFIDAPARLNVAITRARHHLILLGRRAALARSAMWARLIGGIAGGGLADTSAPAAFLEKHFGRPSAAAGSAVLEEDVALGEEDFM